MTIGEKIRLLRTERKLSQKKLGELCEPQIAESTIRKYELGLLNPKIGTLSKISTALGVKVSDLMSNDESFTVEEVIIEQMNELLQELNEKGQNKALEQVELLTKVPEYKENTCTSKSPTIDIPLSDVTNE